MYLKYFVYVSSVNNLSDARYCSGMFVDFIGFNFDENSKNHITIEKFNEIKNWINGPKIVGEFGNSSWSHTQDYLSKVNVDYVSVNYHFNNIKGLKNKLIINIPDINNVEDNLEIITQNSSNVKAITIDKFDESIMNYNKVLSKHDVFVGKKETLNQTELVLKKYNFGLKLSGSVEIRPGYKDYNNLSDILDKITLPT
ncbi:MAG: hypothetical protein CMB81_05365 [Flammeovirgaceae bacterium]|nr:hypothetical protein [Flammeovirgaceae bacterium]